MFIHIIRAFVVHLLFSSLEVRFRLFLPLFSQFFVAERRRKLDDKANEIKHRNPSTSFRVIFHPLFYKVLDIITGDYSRVLLLGVFKTLNDCSNRKIKDEPRNQHQEAHEVED